LSEKKGEKKTVWLYAVVLFTSAFIVLLLTAYSQIKFNKNIDDYRSQISSVEKERINFQMSLSSALEENKKLKADIKNLGENLDDMKKAQKENSEVLEESKKKFDEKLAAYETLLAADKAFNEGDIIKCAALLKKNMKVSLLDSNAMDKYVSLVNKSIKTAAYKLYIEGYSLFKTKDYKASMEKFSLSFELTEGEYYSDDCLYFIAYSEYKLGDLESARKTAGILLQKFPDSSYAGDVAEIIK